MASSQFPGSEGRTVFEWLDGGAFLVQRSTAPDPAPDSTWIIGRDDADEHLTALYSDSRGVSRVYRMGVRAGTWTVWRDAPGFNQRFTATISADGRQIAGAWEMSPDGTTWAHDFDLVYTKVG
jgi:hypothetical protein